jgi:23S rRNA (guanosine2251-2'-O)-methyltransferase
MDIINKTYSIRMRHRLRGVSNNPDIWQAYWKTERSTSLEDEELENGNTRIPYRATLAASAWEGISGTGRQPLPVCVLLENVRSLYNVGAFFRTADAVALEKLYLTGITGYPPQRMITKTALGAEETVVWQHSPEPAKMLADLRAANYEIAAIETSAHAIDLFDWQPCFPVCVLFGHETDGLTPAMAAMADTHIRIPMLGRKHSLNVASAGAVVLYELLRKYRALQLR